MAGVAGRSGRKPKPAEKKLAAGNPGKRTINKDTPSYGEITNVFAPEWLKGHARDLWEHLAPLLCREKILQATDIQNLEAYCAAYGRFRAAEEEIQKHGIVVEGAQGGPYGR
ncbi:Phage terminase, small subunit [compost metagenome]